MYVYVIYRSSTRKAILCTEEINKIQKFIEYSTLQSVIVI